MNRTKSTAAALTAALIAALTLAACGSGSETSSVPGAVPMADGAMMEGAPAAADKAGATVSTPQVITTVWLTMRVASVVEGVSAIERLVAERKGLIQQQDLTTGDGSTTATVVARVPATRLDDFLSGVAGIGTVENISRQASDVTQQALDLDARIAALSTSIQRLNQLLAQAANVADIVAVETELANRQAELDGLTAQRDYLADQVAMSTVTITVLPTVQAGGWQAPGFLAGLQNGIAALVALAGAAITTLGFLAPFLVIVAVIAIPIVWVVIRRARRRG